MIADEIVLSFPNITRVTMSKVLEYCNIHGAGADDETRAFDEQFVDVDQKTLFDLVLAAHDLKIKMLYDIVGERTGDMMKGKTPEEIRIIFNIGENSCVDDHPLQKELNPWAFE
ncbi:hypothetical protein L1987_38240 [Smallanthus sonchifolius]|uniref:Uncharacterized protein n=1 Tax=Smallanthus sonchifolius TaxID=185202 RepID=A0ACB9HIF2_9ASTR|nr:hypothetical protein L1987_38240 [Smallanthus sonchifolius]